MRPRLLVAIVAFAAMVPAAPALAAANHAPQAPTNLTIGDQTRPLSVEGAPAFGWLPRDIDPGETQTAYQIKVSANGSTIWDSGKVA